MTRRLGKVLRDGAPSTDLMAGVVADAPIGPDAPLMVTLGAYGYRMRHEAFGWAPRGDVEPAAGDQVWCRRADDGEVVVVAWHPGTLEADA